MKRRDFLTASAGLVGGMMPGILWAQARPCPPPTLATTGGQSSSTSCATNAEADWLYRTGQASGNPNSDGVVWFHDFRSRAEVDNFRWSGGYKGGNDPLDVARPGTVRHISTDGVTGGGCLEVMRYAGQSDPAAWWRPFSPLSGSGNGRGTDDPGANGIIAPQAYSPSDGSSTIWNWGLRGYYGHPLANDRGGGWDGSEFFLQMRVRMDPRRTASGNSQVGKLTYLTTTRSSNVPQEIVTYSGAFPVEGVGQPNYFRMYSRQYAPIETWDSLGRTSYQQLGSDLGQCRIGDSALRGNCWFWSGGWDTVMYHLKPGRPGVQEQHITVYAARAGETSYTKIWDEVYALYFDSDPATAEGYNALIASAYQNGLQNGEFWHRYDQIILSKKFIPCPQA